MIGILPERLKHKAGSIEHAVVRIGFVASFTVVSSYVVSKHRIQHLAVKVYSVIAVKPEVRVHLGALNELEF